MAAVAQARTLPFEHILLAEPDARWAMRCPDGGQVSASSLRSPDKDSANEDGALIMWPAPGRMVLAVADGLGGMPDGEGASALALTALRDALHEGLADGGEMREAILSGFDRANRAVLARGNGGATTLAVVEMDNGRVRSYHVGDSGVLVFGGRGRMRLQTISHSPVGYAVEAGVLDEEQAMSHEDRHLVSNVIGDRGMHVGMSYPLRLRPMDTVVLASDGLFDNAYTDEIIERLRKGALRDATDALIEDCAGRMREPVEGIPSKPDDLTVVAYRPGR